MRQPWSEVTRPRQVGRLSPGPYPWARGRNVPRRSARPQTTSCPGRPPASVSAFSARPSKRPDKPAADSERRIALPRTGAGSHAHAAVVVLLRCRHHRCAPEPHQRPPSPREVARWIATRPPHRTLDTAERLQRLLTHCPELDRAHTFVLAFAAMFDTGDPGLPPDWLNQLETSRLPGLPSLAKVIREDLPAVVQAITSPYSSGVNEGRITDVKLQKRLMAGGAKIPLLRQRVVRGAPHGCALIGISVHRYSSGARSEVLTHRYLMRRAESLRGCHLRSRHEGLSGT
jgi:Transposase